MTALSARSTAPAPSPSAGSPAPRLAIEDVSKRWSRRPAAVLDHVDLRLEAEEIVSITGPNGVGKTTLLRIAAGLIEPDSGTVTVDGLRSARNRRAYQSRIGFVSAASVGLYARLSVRGHLELWARLALLPRPRREQAVGVALAIFGLAPLADRRVDRISMGQRQRVRLAMAFLHEPALVLLDEPWNSLDAAGHALLMGVLHTFRAGGGTAVICTASGFVPAAPLEFDRVFTIEDGRLVGV